MPPSLSLPVAPQLVANPGVGVLAGVAKEPDRYAIEPKVGRGRAPVAGGQHMTDFDVVSQRTALVNIDMQNWFVRNAYAGRQVLDRINTVASACRRAGILVIHTRAVLRPDGSNMGVMGEMTPVVREGVLNDGSETAALHPDLDVAPADVLLDKPRFGAFHGSDLEVILRSRGIDTLIISGISTEACCDTTAREAHARDFRVFFLSDATAAAWLDPKMAEETHRAALRVLGGLFAQVLTVEQLLQKVSRAATSSRTDRSNSGCSSREAELL